jgi:branched-chain amino acid transport system substrate-binding protein
MQICHHSLLAVIVLGVAAISANLTAAEKRYAPGVSDTEIKLGQTMPYSGPASAWGGVGLAEQAYFKMINDEGGINGRRIQLISLDDAFSPPKTVEQTRKLVEQDGVAIIFGSAGVGHTAVRKYLNDLHVPQLFVLGPPGELSDPRRFPWTMGFLPSYYLESKIYAQYILVHKPDAKIGVLYQSDEWGREHVAGLHDALGENAKRLIVKELSYELSDPTVESQVVSLKAAGADTFYNISSPKFAAQAIRKVNELSWKPLQFLAYDSQSIGAVLEPAELNNSIGIISVTFGKDPTDPRWKDDANTRDYLNWMKKYYPGGKATDIYIGAGYAFSQPLVYVLKQCGDDLSRENIMRQATNLHEVAMPWLLPGLTLNTTPTDYEPIKQLRKMRFTGRTWELLDEAP